jgi:hypothetical protein
LYDDPSKYSNFIGLEVSHDTLSVNEPVVQLMIISSHQEYISQPAGLVITQADILGQLESFMILIVLEFVLLILNALSCAVTIIS